MFLSIDQIVYFWENFNGTRWQRAIGMHSRRGPPDRTRYFSKITRILTKLTTFFHSLCNIPIETRSGAWQSHHRLLEVEKAWLAFNRTLRTSPTCQIFSNISHVVSHPFVIFRTASTRVKSLYLENVLRVIFYFTLRHDIYQKIYTS